MKLFTKSKQVAFVSYALPFCYVEDSLREFPGSICVKAANGWQVWL